MWADTGHIKDLSRLNRVKSLGKGKTKSVRGENSRAHGIGRRGPNGLARPFPAPFGEVKGYLGRSGQRERKGQSRQVKERIVTGKRSLCATPRTGSSIQERISRTVPTVASRTAATLPESIAPISDLSGR